MASTTDEIHAAESARVRAMETADLPALEHLLAEDFIYVHASGRTEDRAAYLASLGSGVFRWSGFTHEDTAVRPLNDTALLYGLLHARKEEAGDTRQLLFRFVSVWVRSDDGWRLSLNDHGRSDRRPGPLRDLPRQERSRHRDGERNCKSHADAHRITTRQARCSTTRAGSSWSGAVCCRTRSCSNS